jgi:drug/metabolite transporter (DMT)-like permease
MAYFTGAEKAKFGGGAYFRRFVHTSRRPGVENGVKQAYRIAFDRKSPQDLSIPLSGSIMSASVRRFLSELSPVTAAVLIMLAGMFLFTLNDAIGKWLTSSYSVGQLVFIRSLVALIILSPFLWRAGVKQLFVVERPWTLFVRVVLTVVDSLTFYFAVASLPLADVMTYWLAAPIYVAAFAPLLLGEHVGWRRWTAIGFGFLGVIIALEPSRAMLSLSALVPILGSMAFGFVLLSARSLRSTPGIAMIFWQTLGGAVVGLCTLPFSWHTPTATDWPLLALLGLLAMLAHVMVNWAFKLADAATVAPLQYTQLFWAIVFGWLVFGDFPSIAKIVGAACIIGSGLYIFFRERKLKKVDKVLPAVPE